MPMGFAFVIVLVQLATISDATAELGVPAAVAAAAAGFGLSYPWGRIDPWAVLAPLLAYAVYAAPVVLSGDPTFTGYIKLDDTATWFALTDRVMEHGRSLEGLAPSSYEATLAFNLADGYPIGAFLPLGRGPRPGGPGRGVGVPAVPRLRRGDARRRAVRPRGHRPSLRTGAHGGRRRRSSARAAVRVRAVGRHQGDRRRRR